MVNQQMQPPAAVTATLSLAQSMSPSPSPFVVELLGPNVILSLALDSGTKSSTTLVKIKQTPTSTEAAPAATLETRKADGVEKSDSNPKRPVSKVCTEDELLAIFQDWYIKGKDLQFPSHLPFIYPKGNVDSKFYERKGQQIKDKIEDISARIAHNREEEKMAKLADREPIYLPLSSTGEIYPMLETQRGFHRRHLHAGEARVEAFLQKPPKSLAESWEWTKEEKKAIAEMAFEMVMEDDLKFMNAAHPVKGDRPVKKPRPEIPRLAEDKHSSRLVKNPKPVKTLEKARKPNPTQTGQHSREQHNVEKQPRPQKPQPQDKPRPEKSQSKEPQPNEPRPQKPRPQEPRPQEQRPEKSQAVEQPQLAQPRPIWEPEQVEDSKHAAQDHSEQPQPKQPEPVEQPEPEQPQAEQPRPVEEPHQVENTQPAQDSEIKEPSQPAQDTEPVQTPQSVEEEPQPVEQEPHPAEESQPAEETGPAEETQSAEESQSTKTRSPQPTHGSLETEFPDSHGGSPPRSNALLALVAAFIYLLFR